MGWELRGSDQEELLRMLPGTGREERKGQSCAELEFGEVVWTGHGRCG